MEVASPPRPRQWQTDHSDTRQSTRPARRSLVSSASPRRQSPVRQPLSGSHTRARSSDSSGSMSRDSRDVASSSSADRASSLQRTGSGRIRRSTISDISEVGEGECHSSPYDQDRRLVADDGGKDASSMEAPRKYSDTRSRHKSTPSSSSPLGSPHYAVPDSVSASLLHQDRQGQGLARVQSRQQSSGHGWFQVRSPKEGRLPWPLSRFRGVGTSRRLIAVGLLSIIVIGMLVLSNAQDGELMDRGVELGQSGLDWLFNPTGAEPVCRFVSPVEAYHQDLSRIEEIYNVDLTGNASRADRSPRHANSRSGSRGRAGHFFSPTGHLVVRDDDNAPHPIPQLLSLGEKRWEELLASQSRTLREAVTEYEHRYHRRPPKGFDKWWAYAIDNELILPDEYDRINTDLAPFWALPRAEMKKRIKDVQSMPEMFIVQVKNGKVITRIEDEGGLRWGGTIPRSKDVSGLIKPFAKYLPDMAATFSIFDQPQIYLSWARRNSLVSLGIHGQHTSFITETDDATVQLSRSCAPDSNLRKNATAYEGKSFIYDSLEANDFCRNPYIIPIHGLTIEPHNSESHPRPHTQVLPVFSLAKTAINSDILIPPLEQFWDKPGPDPAWEKKSELTLNWRGSPTGIAMMTKNVPWRQSHRVRLHQWANTRNTSMIEFMVPDVGQDQDQESSIDEQARHGESEDSDSVEPARRSSRNGRLGYVKESGQMNDIHEFFFDLKLAGHPIQCSHKDGTCDEMGDEIEFAGHQSRRQMNKHKFLLDIDGNGWSGRFRRLMTTNSVVIKAGIFTEWFQPHLIPWFMYVPSKLDFSDLIDIMAFFRGTPRNPDLAFDATAKALAHNGKCFVQRMFRIEDLRAYMFRLMLEYARLSADDGEDMDFVYDPAIHGADEDGDDGYSDILIEEGTGDRDMMTADYVGLPPDHVANIANQLKESDDRPHVLEQPAAASG